MGVVFEARDAAGDTVAVKVLRPERAASTEARMAATAAAGSAAEAKAAGEKVEKIFQKSLRK
jgi:hypothetical protein